MRKLLYIIGFIFCAGGLNAQLDFGFMGKKNSVQLNTYSALNLLHIADYGFSNTVYDHNGDLTDKFSGARISAALRYSRLINERFSVGVEGEFRPVRGTTIRRYFLGEDRSVRFAPRFNMYGITPIFTLHSKSKSMGFKGGSLSFGFGPSFSTTVTPSKVYDSYGNEVAENAFSIPDLLIGFRCFLESGFAIPLNQNFFFNIKYRVGLNIVLSNPEELSDPNNQILVDRNDFKKSLRSKVIGNIMDFNLGIAYQF